MLHRSYQNCKKIVELLMLIIMNAFNKKQTFGKRLWVKSWVGRRKEQGTDYNLFTELWLENRDKFRYVLILSFYVY